MMKYLEERGAKIDELYVCTHSLDDNCECRKPRTGLFERAAKDYGIDLQVSWVIGDSLSDIEAGQRIGASTVVICSDENHPRDPDSGEPIDADEQASNLLEAADIIKNVTGTA